MTNTNSHKAPEEAAERLLPERFSHLLAERPLLWNEDEEDYDTLFGEIFAELDPKGMIEAILSKDIVDHMWEARRMRRMKTAALLVELPRAFSELVRPETSEAMRHHMAIQYQPLVFAAVAGKSVQSQALMKEMEAKNVTPEMAQYAAFRNASSVITAIDASIARFERRRDQLLKQIQDRRQAFKAMAKGLLAREAAEDVDAGTVN